MNWDLPDNQYFKVLGAGRRPMHGGSGQWPKPGKWTEHRVPDPCSSGWHLCRPGDLKQWLGPHIWIAETDGPVMATFDKVIASKARLLYEVTTWDEQLARLFAADCAEYVLHIFEEARPGDNRPRRCIELARLFARGDANHRDLAAARVAAQASALAAAWAGSWVVARHAAQAAAYAAARVVALHAAGAAAGSARDAAQDAAQAAEQTASRLAPWAAAGNAASDSLWAVSGYTALAAAGDATSIWAARDAAQEWQTDKLMGYLTGALT